MSKIINKKDLEEKFPEPELKLDRYGQAINCVETALWVRSELLGNRPVALPLAIGDDFTMFHVTFVNLTYAIPLNCCYCDGSGRGLQISIDRIGSYALPWHSQYHDLSKLNLGVGEEKYLLPFFNTVLSGENCFKKKGF